MIFPLQFFCDDTFKAVLEKAPVHRVPAQLQAVAALAAAALCHGTVPKRWRFAFGRLLIQPRQD